eukprot:CAMPEP_0196806044 /NCGR_PEP_ID=MMETSP1362-20130617/5908_1 /TAXON_ID=163516 /ORGANISM="Leptocylindrus danicus, Strain CCMP1856" /LENGTH=519 /DNA_ID=CAMNT_0042179329 /DNA_START=413 /DNA_END=1972 /DNA_ORIENTATION=-
MRRPNNNNVHNYGAINTTTTTTSRESNRRPYEMQNSELSHDDEHLIDEEDDEFDMEDDEEEGEDDEMIIDEEDDDEILTQSSSTYNNGRRRRRSICTCFRKIMRQLKIFCMNVADVENVWDSPNVSRKRKVGVIFWLLALALSYATERSTFKILVDHAGPFRMFAAEAISALYATILGVTMLCKAFSHGSFECKALGFPLADVGVMAILDSVQLLLCVISGSKIPPVYLVLLVQMNIPVTIALSNCFKRNDDAAAAAGNGEQCHGYTALHLFGACLITAAVLMGLWPAVIEIVDPDSPLTAYNSACNIFIFLLSCIPAAISTLYKEYAMAEYKRPVDPSYLNLVLAIFQVIFTGIISPLVYPLQGFATGGDWTALYPSSEISENFIDSLKCFLGILPKDVAMDSYAEPAQCNAALGLLLGYVLSTVVAGVAVDKIIHSGANNKILYRGLSVGVVLAVLCMVAYDQTIPRDDSELSIVNGMHFACVIVLVLGLEIYHREALPDNSFETVFDEPEFYYGDQ